MRSDEERSGAHGWVWWYGLFIGCLLLAAGAAETVRLVRSGDGGFVFWFGTLVGGGSFVLAGTLLLPHRPRAGFMLTAIGCVAGLLPTMWALIVPVMLVVLIVVSGSRAMAPVRSG
ncbi:hypothetical protein ACIO3S_16800 [Nocardioides sp. NPDC087217]|uniref:hypothetical protein n=1 Tax=Nocardioides sp. NPDC087217 TaxID=3364335 RepID=UPI00382F1CE7